MPFFLSQASYTPEALSRLIANPQDRFDAVRMPIEKLGGRILQSYFAFGEYDVIFIVEAENNVQAASLSMLVSAGGAVKAIKSTPLMSRDEGLDAMRLANEAAKKYSVPRSKRRLSESRQPKAAVG